MTTKPKVPRTALEALFEEEICATGVEVLTPVDIAKWVVQSYRELKPAQMKTNPLEWWQEREIYFPRLSKQATKYFCIQVASVAPERVFSTTGDIVSATWACLSPEHVNALSLVILKKNMTF